MKREGVEGGDMTEWKKGKLGSKPSGVNEGRIKKTGGKGEA